MAIGSYPRTIQNGQLASNGNANAGTGLMLWNSATNSYIAATPSTFAGGAGGATAVNQDTQIEQLGDILGALQQIIQIYTGVYPSLLSGGATNLTQTEGIQVGNSYITGEGNGAINIDGVIRGGLSGVLADVNASNQLKITAA